MNTKNENKENKRKYNYIILFIVLLIITLLYYSKYLYYYWSILNFKVNIDFWIFDINFYIYSK